MKITTYTKEELRDHSYLFNPTALCEIMGRNKSDKGCENLDRGHNYTPIYFKLFKGLRNKEINIFELGVGTTNPKIHCNMGKNGRPGASLYGWAEFFTKANIYGADLDTDILFNTERIKTFYCDQTNPDIIHRMWDSEDLINKDFDIILEDGLHCEKAQICFFENSINKLKVGGYYIIEDIHYHKFISMCDRFHNFKKEGKYSNLEVSIYQIPFPYKTKNLSNGIVVIKKV